MSNIDVVTITLVMTVNMTATLNVDARAANGDGNEGCGRLRPDYFATDAICLFREFISCDLHFPYKYRDSNCFFYAAENMSSLKHWARARPFSIHSVPRARPRPLPLLHFHFRRHKSQYENPGDDPSFQSIADQPPVLVRSGQKRNWLGLTVLALIPLTAFGLGTWQIYRLQRKTDMIARFEDRLVRDPLPLPPTIDPSAIHDFDYRRVVAKGRFRHDQEMLLGPRVRDGNNGFQVVTPFERDDGASTVLVCRGWIPKEKMDQAQRPEGLPQGEVIVEGLLREPWKKNMFTPDNNPAKGEFYFPDVAQMANLTGAQPVWIEETMTPDLLTAYDREAKGIPIGRPAEVNLRNNHTQYIFTWYSLSAATSVMMWMLLRKKPNAARIRQSRAW